jgi:two-component system nitrogen regulation response regulator GlnG/two-component system response regulator HydG
LTIAWSLAEPQRVGEVALVAAQAGSVRVLGRGSPGPGDDGPRLAFGRHRAAAIVSAAWLGGAGISRRQLVFRATAEGLEFERVGRCLVRVNGEPAARGSLRPGDVLVLHNQLVLVCGRRTTVLPSRDAGAFAFGESDVDGLLGESEAAWNLRERLAQAAQSNEHVLVVGPTGSGKELAARAIHRLSSRAAGPFVGRSAAAIPASLLDAELFGNRRDYPNQGMPEREGVVGAASRGTLFLDEIGELSSDMQSHLLRLLDRGGEYHRLGEATPRRSDLRVVAATNRPRDQLKHDFAARFGIVVEVPGLDARIDDVPLIARGLLGEILGSSPELAGRFTETRPGGGRSIRIDPAFVEELLRWPWTAHVRELRALLWSSVHTSAEGYLVRPPEMTARVHPSPTTSTTAAEPPGSPAGGEPPSGPGSTRREDELKSALLEQLTSQRGNVAAVARAMGKAPMQIHRWCKRFGLDPAAFRK